VTAPSTNHICTDTSESDKFLILTSKLYESPGIAPVIYKDNVSFAQSRKNSSVFKVSFFAYTKTANNKNTKTKI
jgi:hypothetical protein